MADGGETVEGEDEPPNMSYPLVTVSDLSSLTVAGRNLKEWLQEQFCDKPLEQCEDMRLHNAAYVGDLDTIKSLLQEDSFKQRINEKSVWCCGWLPCTPLRIAATAGHGECVDFLIAQGAEVDLVDVKGQTALYVAVVNGHLDCVRILLEAGADPNGSRHHRSTPLYHAARVGRTDILQELVRFNADVDVDHQLGPRPLFSARTLSTLVVCPLYISAAYHHLHCFRLLLQAGANPDYNYTGPVSREALARGLASCLLDAVLRHGCEPAFVRLLLEHGADPKLVTWAEPDPDTMGRVRVNSEALRIYQEARRCPRRLTHLCRITIRRVMGKHRLGHISCLPLPYAIKSFLLHGDIRGPDTPALQTHD
ncbi:ankyrin repeat and SOCS box protein 1 isoform X2 [Electrophorus electricus]|uniref:Ankyrin repeat and SOCS box protein 1 n=1 Tax=Electrophorus electricus TaxID=8005 RepID=A0A4W4FKV0_ELEEL|nr:ankyrin repeat and SOCS box protein 1 isoform X2 [Electrophorus electricus]